MPAVISMLRGVNLARHRRMKMDDLKAVYESLKLRDVRTYVQSGNVVFTSDEREFGKLVGRIERAIEKTFGFHSDVVVRTASEMRNVVARNPFAKRRGIEPAKLVVTFLAADPGEAARAAVRKIPTSPEELHIAGRELYIYFPDGQGRSKLPTSAIERALATSGTARNWNSVTKLLEMAEDLDATDRPSSR
jgi:uncharacterized protein (DUF1697 family)